LNDQIQPASQASVVEESLTDEETVAADIFETDPAEPSEGDSWPVPGELHHQPEYEPIPQRDPSCPPQRRLRQRRAAKYGPEFTGLFGRVGGGHRDPDDPLRHFGVGEPLVGTSWRNRPWYLGGFMGGLIGDELQAGLVDQGGGFFAGARIGGDFDHYWGSELRFAMSDVNVNYPNVVRSDQSKITLFDANLLIYPLGDTRWRPFISLGFGVGSFKYRTEAGQEIHASTISLPFGGGVKYLIGRHWAARFEVMDNFTWDSGSHADSMHNISFTGGVEYHFGGWMKSYDPW
jgi:hypothetical protein